MIQNKRLIIIMLAIVMILLMPAIAMQFTNDVTWSSFDFIVAGILLFAAGLGCEVILRKVHKKGYRIAILFLIIVSFVLIWLELAVGIFGTPFSGS